MADETENLNERTALLRNERSSEGSSPSGLAKPTPDSISNLRLSIILGSIWIGVVFTAVDSTVVATLLLPMTNDFASLKTLSWLGSSFLIAATATIPLAGRLTDIFGRHAGAVLCDLVFTVGILICGLASTEWMLLLGRVLSGLGAGPLRTISSFVSSDLVPTQKRGLVQGINLVCMGVGTATGGALGGWISQVLGWRWAFLVQVPFLAVGTVLVHLFVRVPKQTSDVATLRRIDWLGCITLTASLTLLLVGVNAGGNLVPWNDPLVLTTLPLATALLAIFGYVEGWQASEPILPLDLFRNPTVAAACLTYFFAHFAVFGIMFYVPVYIQLRGKSPAQAGLRFIPQAAGNASGAVLAGAAIRRTGTYLGLNYISVACLLASSIAFATLSSSSPSSLLFVYLGVLGIGFGIMLVVAFIALLSSVDHADQAVATSALIALGSAGSTLGISIASAVFQNVLRLDLQRLLGSSKQAEKITEEVRNAFGAIPNVEASIRPKVEQAFAAGVQRVFMLTLIVTAMGAASALVMKQNKLHMKISRED